MDSTLYIEIYRLGSAATDVGLHEWARRFLVGGGVMLLAFLFARVIVRPVLLRGVAALALLMVAGCTTLHARPPAEAQRASLAVLCSDPDVNARARWCSPHGETYHAQREAR
jgi:hypothetical protein